ncbi:MAG: hypothetical protein HY067_10670 [Betaproteobacteria bacterium]|nr:hypothetical protein [Betaproteobacteria bacterium]
MIRTLFIAGSMFVSALASAAPTVDTPGNRLDAANHLFELPAYRLIATRQLYESLNSLPAEQHKRAVAALSDPAVMASLRGVISRSMAQTFSTAELEHLARFLQADVARSMIDKTQSFQSILTKELLTASVSDPELVRILIGR